MKKLSFFLCLWVLASSPAMAEADSVYVLRGEKSFLTGYEAINSDNTINVVIEIPAGTNAKWEVTKPDGQLEWEFKKGKPRIVQYLSYPANYGMVPKTLSGDGDPLDVILLGPAVSRGSVVRARPIGMLKMMDKGEQDDKIIAVYSQSPMADIQSLGALDAKFPGITKILQTWFTSYKGSGKIESNGFQEARAAWQLIEKSSKAFLA